MTLSNKDIGAILVLVILVIIIYMLYNKETFDIPVGRSSGWGWNTGPGYGAGYGTGYAMWGVWPATIKKDPWKNWMWGRRPLIFTKPYTPVPQIDYNYAKYNSKPTTKFNVTLMNNDYFINGKQSPSLQLDRNRTYYFQINTPDQPFMFSIDGITPLTQPTTQDMISVTFDENSPDKLYYISAHNPTFGGEIYLENIR